MNGIEIKTLLSDEDREASIDRVIDGIRPLLDSGPSQSANGQVAQRREEGLHFLKLNGLVMFPRESLREWAASKECSNSAETDTAMESQP